LAETGEAVIRVKIFEQSYGLRGQEAPEYIERLAEYVDGKMRRIADAAHLVDTQKIAVLAALDVADDYFKLRQEYEALARSVEERNRQVCEKLKKVRSAGLGMDPS